MVRLKSAEVRSDLFINLENDGLVYCDETDPEILKDYLRLRREVFEADPVTAKVLKPNQGWRYDLETHVIVAKNNENKCIGGAIMIVKESGSDLLLPLESDDFRLKDVYPELDLGGSICVQFSYLVVDENYRNLKCSSNIFRFIYELCIARGVRYIFSISPYNMARRHLLTIQMLNLGIKAEIEKNIFLPIQDSWNGYRRFLLKISGDSEIRKN